ncbi:DUF4037 domain-containing protein [Ktedonospora formicarum]|uniref:DUF4037 domain-containing protein n=1 Tax=Ktedonospora formicarum TaxID=2778364 RepID=A0A8J3I482_9CHLR|nr:DUF4037 domain-containing protein [Ktedonospora formicarum]GHO46628.1 hypothetical protein KSX_47910 [Ktedonospora formicarum]
MPAFITGIDLSRRFYKEAVLPLLDTSFPSLRYATALIGPGSEVLGFDTEMSIDHDWGPRLFLFLKEEDMKLGDAIADMLSHKLPATFASFSVAFTMSKEPRIARRPLTGPIKHHVIPITVRNFVRVQLGYDLNQPLEVADWLTFPSHALGELTAGEVYHDSVGELTRIRKRFSWYPADIWLYLMAASWQRIGQEEHLMARSGYVGDELGSTLIGTRLIRDVMNLGFLMEKHYAPYAKWFGTAFKRLQCAPELSPLLWQAQQAVSWRERAEALARAYEQMARMHNALGITNALPEHCSDFYDRPFPVIHGEIFARSLVEQISDPEMKRIAEKCLIGNINQWSDNTDIEGIERERLRQLYK